MGVKQENAIEGVVIKHLKIISDERGSVMHMLRADSLHHQKFGEIYFSTINPGIIKGWKKHLHQTQHFAVPVGNIKLVLFDERAGSKTKNQIQVIEIGTNNYQLVRIPPGIWYSFQAQGNDAAMIANCTDTIHDPRESSNLDISNTSIPYDWK